MKPVSELETRLALLESALDDMRHRARNDRQIVVLLEAELQLAHREIVAVKAKMYAGVSVALGIGPLFAWLLEVLR